MIVSVMRIDERINYNDLTESYFSQFSFEKGIIVNTLTDFKRKMRILNPVKYYKLFFY